MAKVRVAAFGVSLDGFGAGPNQGLENPLRRMLCFERPVLDVIQQALQVLMVHIAYNPFSC